MTAGEARGRGADAADGGTPAHGIVERRASHDSVTVRWSAATERGRRRLNEDSLLARSPVFVVADGMGGHAAGDVASALAVDAFLDLAGGAPVDAEAVEASLERAVASVAGASVGDADPGAAGTTLAGAVLVDVDAVAHWLVLNVGDSRTYLLDDGELRQISVDHSLVQELLDAGTVSAQEARTHPERSVITRAIGAGQTPVPDYWLLPVEQGQRLLVCSDGLTAGLEDERIRGILAATPSSADAAASLVSASLAAGSTDNVTVIVADVDDVAGPGRFGDTASMVDGDTVPRAR